MQSPSKFQHRPQKNNTQLFMEKEKPRVAKTILYYKGTSGYIIIPDFKLYYGTTVLKTIKQLGIGIKTDTWINRIKSKNCQISTHLWTTDFWPKKLYNGKKEASSTNGASITGWWYVKECK